MQSFKDQKMQCEVKTDLNLLLECLKYQMGHPISQKESLITIYSICQQNRDASDYFQEIGGLLFVHNLAKSSPHSMVKEAALFMLGGLAENNVFCQQYLCTSGLFEDLRIFLTDQESTVNLKRLSVYVLSALVSNNKSGQTYVKKSGCLDVLLQFFRTAISVSEVNLLDQNINQYHLWSSVCSTLCACVNNPQNEDNQKICSLVFPHAKDWLQNYIKPQIVRPICSFIALTVANNSKIQQFFVSLGGLVVLDDLLGKLIPKPFGNCSNTKLAVVVTKTLDACIADNSVVGGSLSRYNIVPNLLKLLSHNILDSGDQCSVILTLGHCTDGCEENQYTLVKNNGIPVMIQALTESQDEELRKAAVFVLQHCKQTMEKLSFQLTEHSIREDDVGKLEAGLQNKERYLEAYWNEAKEILYRIKSLENEDQEEKRRKTFNDDNPQKAIANSGVACTENEANSLSAQLIANESINAKNELLKPANRNPFDASVRQNEHNNCAQSKNSTAKRNKSVICETSKPKVQASDSVKQPDVKVKSVTQQVQSTELLCSSIIPTSHWISSSRDPKISERRCSGCHTVGFSLNSRTFIKILQHCQCLCEQHKIILETEMKYKMNLKRSILSSRNASLDYKGSLKTKQDIYSEKQTIIQKHNLKDQKLNEKHTYSFENELHSRVQPFAAPWTTTAPQAPLSSAILRSPPRSIESADIMVTDKPATFKKPKRRMRKDFTSEEIKYLLDGVKKMGHHWNSILWAYPFQKGRTNVDLAKKYCKLQKNEKSQNYLTTKEIQ